MRKNDKVLLKFGKLLLKSIDDLLLKNILNNRLIAFLLLRLFSTWITDQSDAIVGP